MLNLVTTKNFKKDVKKCIRRGCDLKELGFVIEKLLNEETLDTKFKDHALLGNYSGFRECHIQPDWLLIYAVNEDKLILTASGTGTHSDLY